MDEHRFNMSLRKYLKEVGVTSQQEIERVVREVMLSHQARKEFVAVEELAALAVFLASDAAASITAAASSILAASVISRASSARNRPQKITSEKATVEPAAR